MIPPTARARLLLSLLVGLLTGCGAEEADPGAAGGVCVSGPQPCGEGLVCISGRCERPDEEAAIALDPSALSITMAVDRTALKPDGVDAATVRVRVLSAETGEPVEGEIVLGLDPPSAGQVTPGRFELQQGLAGFKIIACDASLASCPSKFTAYLATASMPLEPIARTEVLTLDEGVSPPTDMPPATGGAPGEQAPPSTPPRATPSDCDSTTPALYAVVYAGNDNDPASAISRTISAVQEDLDRTAIQYTPGAEAPISILMDGAGDDPASTFSLIFGFHEDGELASIQSDDTLYSREAMQAEGYACDYSSSMTPSLARGIADGRIGFLQLSFSLRCTRAPERLEFDGCLTALGGSGED